MPPVDWSLWHNIYHGPISLRPFDPEPHTWRPVDPRAWGLEGLEVAPANGTRLERRQARASELLRF